MCSKGETRSCTCSGEDESIQICEAENTWGKCACENRGTEIVSAKLPDTCSGVVIFPDEGLESSVRQALENQNDDIIVDDLRELTYLDAYMMDISDLTGLECLINLSELLLGNNLIRDVAPLAGLSNLRELSLANNLISELAPLAGLSNLEALHLNVNQITDLSPLASLTNLTYLSLYLNEMLSDLSPLASLTNLTTLFLELNRVSDLSPLASLTRLRNLDLQGNQISDLEHRTV